MDIVGNLPQEISQHVLSFLTPTELIKCFHVCKKWYNLANTDFLWKRHCVLELLLSGDTNIPLTSKYRNTCSTALCSAFVFMSTYCIIKLYYFRFKWATLQMGKYL